MSALALLLAQAAPLAAQDPAPTDLPSIEILAEVRADQVRIEREGEVSVKLEGHPLAAKDQRTERNREKGASAYSDLVIRTHAYVTLADPLAVAQAREEGEQGEPAEDQDAPLQTTRTGNDEQ